MIYERLFSVLLSIAFTAYVCAQEEVKPLLIERTLPLVTAPKFIEPLDKTFKAVKGNWPLKDGMITPIDIPEQDHLPVLHHLVGLHSAIITLEFRWDGNGTLLVGNDAKTHVGRVNITAKNIRIAESSGSPSKTVAELDTPVEPDVWHKLRVEWTGDRMAANLDGKELKAQHTHFATPKSRSWLGGRNVNVRNLTISGEATTSP